MNPTQTLRVACVGAGYFSQFHYEAWAEIEGVELVGSCNRDIRKARKTGLPAYDNLDLMIKETNPDILDIILPPEAHAQSIRTALSAGIKTIICQKPYCTSMEEAEQVNAEAERHGARIIIHENFRFQPWYRRIKTAIEDGSVGVLLQVTFRLRPGDGQGPRAYLDRQPYFQEMERFLIRETGVHWVDTFRYLMGDPVSVYADLRQINPVIAGEDAGFVIFEHAEGKRSYFDGNRCLDHNAENLRKTMGEALIEGTEGTITLTGDGTVQLRKFGASEFTELLGPDTSIGFGGGCVKALQTHVVSSLLHGTELENLAPDYMSVMQIEKAIYDSAIQGKKIKLGSQ